MILIDTSAWVEFLRDTGSPVCQRVDDLLATEIATCDVVRMEVLAGARDEQHLQQLRRLIARASTLPAEPLDYDAAAALYQTCRQRGHTVRKLIDAPEAPSVISAFVLFESVKEPLINLLGGLALIGFAALVEMLRNVEADARRSREALESMMVSGVLSERE